MEHQVWKEFAKNELTHSGAHYLITISQLLKKQGYARLSDMAKELNVSKGSLSTSLKTLVKRDYIHVDENKHFKLTKKGLEALHNILGTSFIVKRFLNSILGVDEEMAEIDACKIEHLLSKQSARKMLSLMRVLKKDSELLSTIQQDMREVESATEDLKFDEACVIRGF
jgi:Mn-dependent DtxR family transcriptional regulator